MFEYNLYEFENIIESELGEDVELFYDIHCDDPFVKKQGFDFPVIFLHNTGVYISILLDDFITAETKSDLEYIGRVFKSRFSSMLRIRKAFLFRKNEDEEARNKLVVYDFDNGTFSTLGEGGSEDVSNYLTLCFKSDIYMADEAEYEELALKLSKESSDNFDSNPSDKNTFVKRKGEWVPAFQQNSEKAFYLALFGGFLGLHRFYLGLFGSGTLYFFTFGCLGVGWFFDCVEMLLGQWKRNDKYLAPLKNKTKCVLMLFIVSVAHITLIALVLSFFLKNIQNF